MMDDLFGCPPRAANDNVRDRSVEKPRDRRAEHERRLARSPDRVCEHCGAVFKKVQKDKLPPRYCSKVCSGSAGMAAIHAGRLPCPVSYSVYRPLCGCCGVRFTASNRLARLCSDECRAEDARVKARKYAEANDNRDRSARPCAECGDPFIPEYGNKKSKYCSDNCMKRATRRVSKGLRKARMRATIVEPVNPIAVFDRDGWMCQLCGVETPRELRGTYDNAAPELDHVVPLSKGGAHTYDNTQCSCRECNQRKSDIMPMVA
jgi:5-methylcytosine-specific restriction endonuclease McrA